MVTTPDPARWRLPLSIAVILLACLLHGGPAGALDKTGPMLTRSYAGTINNKYRIRMTLDIWEDGVITGEYHYLKNSIVIPLEGTCDTARQVVLTEKAPRLENTPRENDITGSFRGLFTPDFSAVSGTWSNFGSTRSYPFKLSRAAHAPASEGGIEQPAATILALPVSVGDRRKLLQEIRANSSGSEEEGDYSEISVEYSSPHLLSMLINSHYQGGAHPNSSYGVRNYWLTNNHAVAIGLGDLFRATTPYRKLLSDLCLAELKRQNAGNVADGSTTALGDEMNEFVITPRGLIFYFARYVVGSYAEGEHIVRIPYKKIMHLARPDGPLAEFIRTDTTPRVTPGDLNVQLVAAADALDEALVGELLARGAKPDLLNADGDPLLHWAVHQQELPIARLLLEHGAKLTTEDRDGETPLLVAVRDNEVGPARLLLEKGAQVNAATSTGSYPLLVALQAGHREMVEFLLKNGAATTVTDRDGATPLHLACQHNDAKLAELLLRHGAAVNARDASGTTPLMRVRTVELAQLLLDKGARVDLLNSSGGSVLNNAIGIELTELFVSRGADVNQRTAFGGTPLKVAAYYGDSASVRFLVSRGARVNERGESDDTPLMATAHAQGSREVAAFLIEKGADLDARDNRGYTALMYAASGNNREVLELLVNAGAKLNIRDTFSRETALTIARKSGFTAIHTYLRQHGGVE
jgi:ankyrin repeat protein